MPRRTFLYRTLIGAAGIVTLPVGLAPARQPLLWIADPDADVTATIQLLTQHYQLAEARVFRCKRQVIASLHREPRKPTFLVTDYFGGPMRGAEFIHWARRAAPTTKVILFSAVVGSLATWRTIAGAAAPAPDVIIEKPDLQKLLDIFGKFPFSRPRVEFAT